MCLKHLLKPEEDFSLKDSFLRKGMLKQYLPIGVIDIKLQRRGLLFTHSTAADLIVKTDNFAEEIFNISFH